MNLALPPIQELLEITGSWKILTQNSFLAHFIEGSDKDLIVPKEYIAQAHPLLPSAIEQGIAWNHAQGKPSSMAGASVFASNELLNDRTYRFIDSEAKTQYFTTILNIVWDDIDVGIFGKWIKVQTSVVDDMAVPFVTIRTNANIKVPIKYIDEHFPGWRERYKLGFDLGLETKELMVEVFSVQPKHTTTAGIEGLTFD